MMDGLDSKELQAIKQRFGIIGNSPGLNNALSVAIRVAPTPLSVLITGESGVGKEVFSQIIHQLSPRRHHPFIAVNCGAIPEGTIDSELFGHEKGSFTGAHEARKGYFESVKGGTIFLDEIGELPIGTQARLLRVLEAGEFIRVGSSQVQKTDVRIIAATNVELLDLIRKGKFREDLYYRLSTVPIKVPPLRDRKEDIYWLFRKFVTDFSDRHKTPAVQLDDSAKVLIMQYHWPGNIRELKNIAEQICVLSKDKIITALELKAFLQSQHTSLLPALKADMPTVDEPLNMSERELFYKLFFDMKKDLNELKQFVLEMAAQQQSDFDNPSVKSTSLLNGAKENPMIQKTTDRIYSESPPSALIITPPIVTTAQVEETLSLMDQEKEMIRKALIKHKSRRKDAAAELGISERTLYRKIKEYKIVE